MIDKIQDAVDSAGMNGHAMILLWSPRRPREEITPPGLWIRSLNDLKLSIKMLKINVCLVFF